MNSLLSPLAEHDDTGETWLPAGSEAAGVEGEQPIFHTHSHGVEVEELLKTTPLMAKPVALRKKPWKKLKLTRVVT